MKQFYEEELRKKRSKLSFKLVFPDRWSKMNVMLSKQPFDFSVICAMMEDITDVVGGMHELVQQRSQHLPVIDKRPSSTTAIIISLQLKC